MADQKHNQKLPAAVAEHYELVNWTGYDTMDFGRFGEVQLSTMTIQKAEMLIKKGFTKLRKKETPKAKAEAKK